jgi:hypothetical protein
MKHTTRRSPADRDRAMARLRTLTIGSAVGGFAAVAAFGAVAAASDRGTDSTAIITAAITTTGTSTLSTAQATTPTATAVTAPATPTQTPIVASTSGSANATSGGS